MFFKPTILPKNELMNWVFFAWQYYDRIVSFIFWKNWRIAKSPFEINWPLVRLKIAQEFGDRVTNISKQKPTCIFTNFSSQKTRKKHSTLFTQIFSTNCFKNTGYFKLYNIRKKNLVKSRGANDGCWHLTIFFQKKKI